MDQKLFMIDSEEEGAIEKHYVLLIIFKNIDYENFEIASTYTRLHQKKWSK